MKNNIIDESKKPGKSGPQSPVMDLSKENKPCRFVIQEHQRGKSSHLDFRLEVNDHLIGFTLDDPGEVGNQLRFRNDAEYSEKHKVLCQMKSRQPGEWLNVKGIIEPGEIGATKHLPARFIGLDSGTYEMGAQKPYMLEVFLKGKRYKGKYMFRKLPRPGGLEKAGNKTLAWFGWKPVDQVPYVLTSRAINICWIPPQGKSAMPKEWEDKIPGELQWWKKNWGGAQALEQIKEIRNTLLKRNVLTLDKLNFALKRVWWKGQDDIKKMPVEKWWLMFSNGLYFELDENPTVQKKGINSVKKIFTDQPEWMDFKGEIAPGKLGNLNKKIPAHVEILEKGKVDSVENTERFMSYKFSGQKLQGFWTAKATNGTWILEQSQTDAKPKKLSSIELSEYQIGSIYKLTKEANLSLNDISKEVGCSKSSVMYWQKKMDLR